MRQAIVTRFLCPTNSRGARVKAYCDAGSITVHWNDALDPERNHQVAAMVLATKLHWTGWRGEWVVGGMPQRSADAYVYVFHERP